MFKTTATLLVCVGVLVSSSAAEQVPPLAALARMPIREVTAFKDGHAYVLHEGKMPTDGDGNVSMDYLPTPVLGTFWTYAIDKGVKLKSVVASRRLIRTEATALTIREMLEANVGAKVIIREQPSGVREDTGLKYEAVIAGIPQRSSEELAKTSPPNTPPQPPTQGNIILLKTADGIKAMPIGKIAEVTFKDAPKAAAGRVEFRHLLQLELTGTKKNQPVGVGMVYVQKGLRWIPSYKVTVDGKGSAAIELEATLVNDLADLDNVTLNLVIGVPTFAFAGELDPIAMQHQLASLGRRFDASAVTGQALSNAIMTQSQYSIGSARPPRAAAAPGNPSQQAEDLFIFTLKNITLKKGQRMVLPVAQFAVKYRDVYILDVPVAPPVEMWRHINSSRQAELQRMLRRPKVMHKLRLTNDSKYPLTTSPAMIVRDGRVLGQGMMTYTPVGADVELPVTAAVDVAVRKSEKEALRVPNAQTWAGHSYFRVDLAGTIRLANHKNKAVDLEVTHRVLGNPTKADRDGTVVKTNFMEDDGLLDPASRPAWWSWYSWPYWWGHFNGAGRITWKFKLEPGKSTELKYEWHYFWR